MFGVDILIFKTDILYRGFFDHVGITQKSLWIMVATYSIWEKQLARILISSI